jgi:hypothetical protein
MKTKSLFTLLLSVTAYFTVGDPTGYNTLQQTADNISIKTTIKHYLMVKEEALVYELNHKLDTFPILNKKK